MVPSPQEILKLLEAIHPSCKCYPECHQKSLVWMMKRADDSFCVIADHRVIRYLFHAKKMVLFKTFTSGIGDNHSKFNAQFFGGIGFGTNNYRYIY